MKIEKKTKKTLILPITCCILTLLASFSATAAWFATNNSVSATTMSISALNDNGDLHLISVTPGVGTELGDDKSILVKGLMLDASYDHIADNLYTDVSSGGFRLLEGADKTTSTRRKSWLGETKNSVNSWYAVSWKYTFIYYFNDSPNTTVNFYFNASESRITGVSENQTGTGFRIAFLPGESTANSLVFAGAQAKENCSYVNSTSTTGTYNTDLIATDTYTSYTQAADHEADATSRNDYLYTFSTSSANYNSTNKTDTVVVECVAWFEGTDPNVIMGKTLDTVSATLSFYTAIA